MIISKRNIPSDWLYLVLKNLDTNSVKKGVAQPFMSNGDIKNMEVKLPPQRLFRKFSQQIPPLINRLEGNKEKSRTLDNFRDTLLQKLIRGTVEVWK